jgi:hypothetical protein
MAGIPPRTRSVIWCLRPANRGGKCGIRKFQQLGLSKAAAKKAAKVAKKNGKKKS